MNATLRYLPNLLVGIIFFAKLSSAVCPGRSHQTGLAGCALSPDAKRITAIADDGALFWWDVASGKRTQLVDCVTPDGFDHPILFGPDSDQLAIALGERDPGLRHLHRKCDCSADQPRTERGLQHYLQRRWAATRRELRSRRCGLGHQQPS